ncbi:MULTISPECIES: ABC transporter permease [Chelativorans]|jgi:NitT/TauT family transport system permease protein|uniref:Binding-protein-dependent transport systems inner membrane component n=1 Tax=Chelativorans sp. (strain BNC1) TaxID=266779 RepID=Q11K66_CHESB|nr:MULTISPECIES: ABC transporter permease subunit [Chelativorans]
MTVLEKGARTNMAASVQSEEAGLRHLWSKFVSSPGALRLALVIGFFAAWEIYASFFANPRFLPPISEVVLSLPKFFQIRNMTLALGITAFEVAVAFVMAVAIGVAVGIALGFSRVLNQTFMPIVLLIYATPNAVFLPLFMLLFGLGVTSKIAYGFAHGVFPIIITVAAGVANLKPVLLASARSMGASRYQILRHVIFPHMLPNFFAAMRLGMATTLLGVILSELFVSQAGIGHFARLFSMTFQTVNLYALILLVTTIAIIINEILRRQEARLSKWRD